MNQYSRRQWLKFTGMAGLATAMGTSEVFAEPTHKPSSPHSNGIIRLSSNENPYGPSPKVREAMIKGFDDACRYPYSFQGELLEMLADKHGVSKNHLLLVAGSTEGLKITGLTYGRQGEEIVTADPVYKSLISYAEHVGAKIQRVPVTEDMQHDLREMEARINDRTSLVFVCNPNNPTGTLIPAQEFEDFCARVSKRTLVFSDEAYFDYITEPEYPSMISLVKQDADVVVSRTFSKVFGLAGLRIGYLIARPDIIQKIRGHIVASPNVLAIYAAIEALKDKEFYDLCLEKNQVCKDHITQVLDDLGLYHVPSATNFIFFKSGRDIKTLAAQIKEEGVQVGRPFPPLTDWCRVSTGRTEDMAVLERAMRKVLS